MLQMGTRWKGKESETKALANPMSKIVSHLQTSLIQSNSHGLLSGSSVLLETDPEQTDIFKRACFGRPVITTQTDKQWFQLSLEEAFYLCYTLRCIRITGEDNVAKSDEELWKYMVSKRRNFSNLFKGYAHLRMKNWVVKSGSQYGVDYVAYRHHPKLVHSEYAVLVLSGNEEDGRLRVWSDFHCTLRLCGSVAKTLLVLEVRKNGDGDGDVFPLCLESGGVEERTICRWIPEHSRESQSKVENPTKWQS